MKKKLEKLKQWIDSEQVLLACSTATCIGLYLIFRFIFQLTDFFQDLPLFFALFFGGVPLLYSLCMDIIRWEFSSDILAGMSIVTATLLGQYLAGTIVVLMLSGGQALELYAVRRASFLLEALSKRMPSIAHKKRKDTIIDVPLNEVEIADLLLIYPHEICPVDGLVEEGQGIMDESYLTGEPFLISKTPGANVFSGAINGDRALVIKATKKAVDSRYAKIMQVMLASEEKKPKIRRLGDWLGAFYTPIALAIALIAWLVSSDPIRFLAVLVIATPCPLLIAIPVAIIGAISLSASRGIIIKNPSILEQISKCRTIIFDKTGTLTYGKPNLTKITYYCDIPQLQVLSLAASVERYSKHPLSAPILAAAEQEKLSFEPVSQMSEKPGEGLLGMVDSHSIRILGRSLLAKQGRLEYVERLPQEEGLECIVLIDGKLSAHFQFRDTPRTDSRSFVAHLGPIHQFAKMIIVSGDRAREVNYLAEQIGISEVYAGKTPEEKVEIVEKEGKENPVIFLGDGINDAPALAAATVGIAFGQNSDITMEAADAVVLDNSLQRVDELLHIGSRMRRVALQSALLGMGLSIIGMIWAAFGYLPPVMGAISQEVIDVFAVLNALRVAFPRSKLYDFKIL